MRKHEQEGAVLLVTLGVDILGEPPARWHPVVWYGNLIRLLERAAPRRPFAQLLYGAAMLILAAPVAFLPALFWEQLAGKVRVCCVRSGRRYRAGFLYALMIGSALKPFFALQMLVRAGREVRVALERSDLLAAREALRSLVSRDRSQLSPELVVAATVESLAENLCDSVVAPLFYYALTGLPGAAFYRLMNTFDSMIGYHGKYEYLGKAAARLDDLLNVVPARCTALLIIALAPFFGGNRRRAWLIWRRDARQTESPNAGHPMAAAAGALGVELEKVGYYVLGEQEKALSSQSIRRAEQMVRWVGLGAIFLTAVYRMLRSVYGRGQ